jgi:hypothetical protein
MMQLADLLAREEIRDLVARYNSFGDSGLFDPMIELFAPDAVLEVNGRKYEGRDAIRGVFADVPKRTSSTGGPPAYLRHCTATHQIDLVDETSATGRHYFFVLTRVGLDHWGRYLDEYRVVEGAWRFSRRRVVTDTTAETSLFSSSVTPT